MSSETMLPDNITSRLRWLMLARVLIVTFLLGIAAFVEFKEMEPLSAISSSALFKAIILTYLLSILYRFLLKSIPSLPVNLYIQSLCDVLLVTGLVYATGGIRSIYSVLYPLVIIYSVLFLERRGGLVIASAAGILYGLLANLEFYHMIVPTHSILVYDPLLDSRYFMIRIATHIFSFYLIAFLTSFVAAQEKKTRTLLAKKQNDFAQLHLLHRGIIESVDTGILTVDMQGRIKSFNRAASEITGLTLRKIENREFSEVFPEFPPLPERGEGDGYRAGLKTHFDAAFHTPGGKRLLLSGSLSPLRDHQGAQIGRIITFQDLTEINEMKESLEKSRRLAFIGEVAAGLAHEIRNPLSSISGSIQLLMQDPSQRETNERLMQIILRGKDQLENFLRDFLLMARPAPGIREQVDIGTAVREVLDSLHCVPDWHDSLELRLKLPETPLWIQANRTEIRQVLWNVILNAVQAMPERGRLTVEAHLKKTDEREGVEIRILDTGLGIGEQDLPRIFEPFYTTRKSGTGLGLAVVGRIVEGYGGEIRIQSSSPRGALCRIWFPCGRHSGETGGH